MIKLNRERLGHFLIALDTRPMGTAIPLGLTALGVHALIRGDNVSRAFSSIGGGSTVRFLGALLVLGGLMFATAIYRDDAMIEILALGFTLAGATMYTIGAIFGLGEQGSMAGGAYLLITLGCIGRIRVILRRGDRRARL